MENERSKGTSPIARLGESPLRRMMHTWAKGWYEGQKLFAHPYTLRNFNWGKLKMEKENAE